MSLARKTVPKQNEVGMTAQIAFKLTYQTSQHQVAFPLDTYRLLVQYLGLQFGHQMLHVLQPLSQRVNMNKKEYLALK